MFKQAKSGKEMPADIREVLKDTIGLLINNLILDNNSFNVDLVDQKLPEIPKEVDISLVLKRCKKLYQGQDELKNIL